MNGADDPWRPSLENLIKVVPLGLGLATALFYGVLRLAYLQYYAQLGLSPEEVGLSRTELLSQAIVGPIAVIAGSGLYVIVVAVVALLIFGSLTLRRAIASASVGFALTTLLTFVILYSEAQAAGSAVVEKGESVRTIYLDWQVVRVPLLDVRALPVEIEWKDAAKVPSVLKRDPTCLFYLGETKDTVVVYNVKTRQSVRFGKAEALISTAIKPDRLDGACLAAAPPG